MSFFNHESISRKVAKYGIRVFKKIIKVDDTDFLSIFSIHQSKVTKGNWKETQ